jgi:sporulation protein YlmC with PRC-barrel domain
MKANRINGTTVITAKAYVLGEVDGAEVDTDKWKVTHIDVNLTKEATEELGFKKPFLGSIKICLPITIIKEFGDVITLKNSLQELKNLKECKGS